MVIPSCIQPPPPPCPPALLSISAARISIKTASSDGSRSPFSSRSRCSTQFLPHKFCAIAREARRQADATQNKLRFIRFPSNQSSTVRSCGRSVTKPVPERCVCTGIKTDRGRITSAPCPQSEGITIRYLSAARNVSITWKFFVRRDDWQHEVCVLRVVDTSNPFDVPAHRIRPVCPPARGDLFCQPCHAADLYCAHRREICGLAEKPPGRHRSRDCTLYILYSIF